MKLPQIGIVNIGHINFTFTKEVISIIILVPKLDDYLLVYDVVNGKVEDILADMGSIGLNLMT